MYLVAAFALVVAGPAGAALAHAAMATPPAATYDYDRLAAFVQGGSANPLHLHASPESLTARGQGGFTLTRLGIRAGVAAEEGLTWAEQSGILRAAARGKGNFGLGSATSEEADALGQAWVGENYTVASDGRTLVSESGLRQYRPPSYKPNLGRYQANFEQRFEGQQTRGWQSNGHLDIPNLP